MTPWDIRFEGDHFVTFISKPKKFFRAAPFIGVYQPLHQQRTNPFRDFITWIMSVGEGELSAPKGRQVPDLTLEMHPE